MELLSAESDRITQGQGLKGRFSLQGRRRNSLTTLCPSSNGGVTQTTKNSAPPNCASELAASNCYYENLKNIRQRRNSSYVPMISDKSRSSFSHTPSSKNGVGVPGDEINLDDESVTNIIPMVVLTPESPPRELLSGDKDEKLKKWDLYEYGKKPVQTLFKPVSNSTVNSVKHHSSQGNGKRKRDLLILGRTSSVTATTLDLERIANDNDDILNNNSSGDSVAKRDLDETGSNSSASSVCSLSTTTLSQGELSLLHCNDQDQIVPLATTAFTTIRCKSISVNPGLKSDDPNKVTRSTTSSTVFTLPKMSSPRIVTSGMANGHGSSNLCPENPFRKVFARRKEFYQTIGSRQENYSSVNRLLWRKRHCTLCCAENRKCEMPPNVAAAKKEASPPPSIITLNANIEPFAPFTIKHDVESVDDSELRLEECEPANNSSGEILKTLGPSDGLEFSPDGKELRYATSTINSEEGVESHLEVSLAKNGTSMITTRTKRVGSPSEIANNSLLQVQTDESGRKIFSIQQTCQKRQLTQPRQPRPSSLNLNNSPPFFLANDLVGMGEQLITTDNGGRAPYPPFLSNSAYCTQMTSSSQMCKDTEYVPGPRYNSLPNLFGRVPIMSVDPAAGGNHNPVVPPGLDWVGGPGSISSGSKNWLYNAHPEDEKKRIAYTRGRRD